jgi:soluble lytic murein transglycosylase-like protein
MRRSSLSLALVALIAFAAFGAADFDTSSSAITAATYVVTAGDTLTSIAGRAGVSVSDLARANHLADPNLILVGQVLAIPGRPVAAPASANAAPPPASEVRRLATASLDPTCHAPETAWFQVVAADQSIANLPRLLRHRPQRMVLRPCFEAWAAHYGIPAPLVEGLAWEESGWQNDVVSSANAYGIGQLTPPTTQFIQDLIGRPLSVAIPDQNIHMTARFLAFLLGQTNGDVNQAVAGYYQGLLSVRQSGMLPETKQYVADVLYFSSLFR